MSGRTQSLQARLFWFGVGAVVSYLLISTPLRWLRANTALPVWAISTLSTGVSVTFFFFWNYHVNFRTASGRRGALARYLVVALVMWAASSTVLTQCLRWFPALSEVVLGPLRVNVNVVLTQAALGLVKFFLYHTWAFPPHREGGVNGSAPASDRPAR
jgi:hypothetical protein